MNSIEHMKRWIKASFIVTFRDLLDGKPFFIEGDDRMPDKEKKLELRIDGPYLTSNGTRREKCCYIEVNLLCTSTRNEKNVYDRENFQGFLMMLLDRDFCINRIGNEDDQPADDGGEVGIMQRMRVEALKLSDFGRVDDATEVYQASAEQHYEMHYTIN